MTPAPTSYNRIISTTRLSPPGGATPQKRKSHSLVSYRNKYLILFGGYSGSRHTNDVWLYAPVLNSSSEQHASQNSSSSITLNHATTWKRIECNNIQHHATSNPVDSIPTATPSKRHCHAAAIYRHYMVVFGGDSGGNEILNDLWLLDLRGANHQWIKVEYPQQHPHSTSNRGATSSSSSYISHIPKPRYAHTAVVIQDSLWIFGGFTRKTTKAAGMYLDDLWCFHFPSKTWRQISHRQPREERPSKRCYHSAVVYNESNILIFGGSSMGQYLDDAWIFDTRTELWTKVQIQQQDASDTGSTRSTSRHRASAPHTARKTSIQELRQEQICPEPRAKHAATMYDQNLMFVSGGYTGLFRENDFWMLHIEEYSSEYCVGRWYRLDGAPQSAHKLPVARDSHSVAMLGEHLMLFGGSGTGKLLKDFWTFDMSRVIQHFPQRVKQNNRSHNSSISAGGDSLSSSGIGDGALSGNSHLKAESRASPFAHQQNRSSPLVSKGSHSLASDEPSHHGNGTHHTYHMDQYDQAHSHISESSDYRYPRSQNTYSRSNKTEEELHKQESDNESTSSSLEDEFFGQLSEALEDKERMQTFLTRQNEEKQQYGTENKRDSPYESRSMAVRENTPSPSWKSPSSYQSSHHSPSRSPHNMDSSSEPLAALQQQIQVLTERQEREEKRNEQFRTQVLKELNQAKNIMKKQGEALEGLETVVHKEIQTRIAGEDKTQAYFNFISSQQANALALQTHQYQLSVERISQILQQLMNGKGQNAASAIENLPSAREASPSKSSGMQEQQ